MRLPTYGEIETKVRADLDLQDTDNFVGQDEMAGYCNEGITTAEAMILMANEDYFKVNSTVTLVSGTGEYALPSDIYAQKIRELVYSNGDRIYPITRLKDPQSLYQRLIIQRQATSLEEYKWDLVSQSGAQDTLRLIPTPQESGAFVVMEYIRTAKRVPLQASSEAASRATQIATVIDIPEWRLYLEQYMKVRCYEKTKEADKLAGAKGDLQAITSTMMADLKDRAKDNENEVPLDLSHYVEHN